MEHRVPGAIYKYKDQMGRSIALGGQPPSRIVSLVPSLTELLFDLGLEDEVVGITKFCVHPPQWFQSKTRVGGTKKIDFAAIAALRPELIIGNKEENEREQVEALMEGYNVWMSDIETLEGALQMIAQVSCMVGKEKQGVALIAQIERAFASLRAHGNERMEPRKAINLIWNEPLMEVGPGTFIDAMLPYAGFKNLLAAADVRYPVLTAEALKDLEPEYLLLSSEPFPFAAKHVAGFQKLLPSCKIILVDGEYFSWYGSRLVGAATYFEELQRTVSLL